MPSCFIFPSRPLTDIFVSRSPASTFHGDPPTMFVPPLYMPHWIEAQDLVY
ncbi:hypothetical protein CDL15_Pgr022329 [Punica granatum]|uniref:Uncharacterized protein n=1 Tax=Punica granatum TaxID=22663 RepID=A0A218Y3C5_PUNGR|nr:hypothetical protein CDL15_Pgr022329 [Punica granatum]